MYVIGCLLFATVFVAAPVQANDAPRALPGPGVLLTFDDAHVDEWVVALPLFARYQARVTFFVTRFDTLSPAQIAGLRTLEEAGHTIGCHGLRHRKAAEYVAEHGMENYLDAEITPALAQMEAAGFVPRSFAYPSSNNDHATDGELLKTFRYLRTGTGVREGERLAQMDRLFTATIAFSAPRCLTGKGVDRIGYPGNEDALAQLFEAMERAAERGELLTLYAHGIAAEGKHHHIQPATLEKILAHGQALGLRFYAFDELP